VSSFVGDAWGSGRASASTSPESAALASTGGGVETSAGASSLDASGDASGGPASGVAGTTES
jgi:hypothetical protein